MQLKVLWSFLALILCLASLMEATQADAAVWENKHQWLEPVQAGSSATWEDAYSQWVGTKVDETIFSSPSSRYYQIATDCADAVYVLRMIFSFENGLPFVYSNSQGQHLSNSTSRYDSLNLNTNQKFRAFIKDVENIVNVKTLSMDTYPIAISRDTLKPGVVMLYIRPEVQHSMTLRHVNELGVTEFLAATEPYQVWKLDVRTMITEPPYGSTSQPFDGLRRWRHHELGLKAEQERGYSVEQFSFPKSPASAWGEAIQDRLALFGTEIDYPLKSSIYDLCDYVRDLRVKVVNDALVKKAQMKSEGRSCMNEAEYNNFSTPWRDFNISRGLLALDLYAAKYNDSGTGQKLRNLTEQMLAQCSIYYSSSDPSAFTTLLDLRDGLKAGTVSSNPNDSVEARWGIPGASRSHCPEYK